MPAVTSGGDDVSHLLKEDEVGQRADVLEALAFKLRKPGEGFAEAEEPVLVVTRRRSAAGAVISAALSRSHVSSDVYLDLMVQFSSEFRP